MKRLPRFRSILALCISMMIATLVCAQGVVSSGLTGLVHDASGKSLAGATLQATHTATGTTYTATSGNTGRFNFRGLIVGGPYTLAVSATGFKPVEQTGITTALGQAIDVNFILDPTDVVVMEKFNVQGEANALDSSATGAGSVITREQLLARPTSQRSFADMARSNSLVTLRNIFGDRQEGMLTAVGQNNRFNSVMLDGARINDQFGLNASGLQSFFNPLSLETIEQFSVSVSPYDIRQSGFTGAAINAVTRSGTNTFHGSLYTYYTDQKFAGKDFNGAFAGQEPLDKRTTWGATLGGPIWTNKLFFFANYEKFKREQIASSPGLIPAAGDLATIDATLATLKSASGKNYDWGAFGGASSIETEETKKLYKIDWNITNDHRLSVRYNETIGALPQFGRLSTTGSFTGILGSAGPSAAKGTSYSSNFYTQKRTERVYAATLNDQWTPDFKTEFKWAKTSYEQLTASPSALPEIRIFGVTGVGNDGVTRANNALFLGTEQFRHGNVIQVKTQSYSGNADYFWKNFTFTAGFDREDSDFYNLFRQSSYGLFDYASLGDFAADQPSAFTRAFYVQSSPAADLSNFANTGFFAQAKWDITNHFNLTAGARIDLVNSDSRPTFNQKFTDTFGLRNDGSVDGTQSTSPRLGFNWAVTDDRTTQLRGGAGHFTGRAPWVFISNAYGNTGVGRFSVLQSGATPVTLTSYLRDTFDQANPIGVAPSDADPNARREINLLSDKLKLPSVWRGNLAVDQKLNALGATVTAEFVYTQNEKALFTDNLNIQPLIVTALSGPSVGLDGRQRFNGAATSPGALSTAFANVIRVRNVKAGESSYASITLDRPMKGNWAYNVAYTRGRSTEAQAFGQTVASDGWTRNAVFNQNAVEVARSDFEMKDRVQVTVTRQFELSKGWKTGVSLYYEGHTGNPYSFTYANDLNADGVTTNDLVYVPTGANDAKVDYSGLTAQQQTDYLAFIQSSGLNKYAGSYAPRNAFNQPWINQLDLRITQKLPIYKPFEVELFFDFINFGYWLSRGTFGYVELIGNSSNATFYRRTLAAATYNATGQIKPTWAGDPAGATIDNVASRWRMQFGATLKF